MSVWPVALVFNMLAGWVMAACLARDLDKAWIEPERRPRLARFALACIVLGLVPLVIPLAKETWNNARTLHGGMRKLVRTARLPAKPPKPELPKATARQLPTKAPADCCAPNCEACERLQAE